MRNYSFHLESTWRLFFFAVGTCAIVVGILSETSVSEEPDLKDKLLKDARDNFQPVPKDAGTRDFPVTPERVSLGRKLFFEPRISVDGVGSCVRCHQPALYGTDGLAKSRGVHDKVAPRNAPSVLNSGLQIKAHWDGLFENVEEQARKALLGPGFGNTDFQSAMAKIKAIPGYTELFHKAFPDDADPVTETNWGKAIGAYERTLVTSSRFDDYLGGKMDALPVDERRGLREFVDIGCADCHNGSAIGGNRFEKFGVKGDYWKETRSQEIDKGRFNVTKDSSDIYVFKVPGLRNVAMSPPYFHDGSISTLPETVRIMARLQLGKTLSDDETKDIVTFLQCLTGNLPEGFANAPLLPPAAFDSRAAGP